MNDGVHTDDIETIESNDEAENIESKPLLSLFERLIGNNKKTPNTILTNAQIINILHHEFNMPVSDLHELEVDIYLSVMKRFLKDWPQWDEFDRLVIQLKEQNDSAGLNRALELKYKQLKDYLQTMINAAESLAKKTLKSLPCEPAPSTSYQTASKDTNDVVMEVRCTRAQLNQLIYKYPILDVDTIFNIEEVPRPQKIRLTPPSFNTIINWWCFALHVNLSALAFKRETVSELKHFLVNKKLNIKTEIPPVNTRFQEKSASKSKNIPKAHLFTVLDTTMRTLKKMTYKYLIEIIIELLKKDMNEAPGNLKVPAMYRKCFSMHPYVRHLSADPPGSVDKCLMELLGTPVPNNSIETKKYDLHLEETIIPMYQVNIFKFDNTATKINLDEKSFPEKIFVECKECKIKFRGLEILREMQQHFSACHHNEPDWECRNCHKVFTMQALTESRWSHKCT